jgi:RNA recognition motif-containing protein
MSRNWVLLLRRGVISFSKGYYFMSKSIYVGNLPWDASERQIQELFSSFGNVLSVKLVSDRDTGRARGFGFVEMEEADAPAAIEALDNFSLGGRSLRVNEAKPSTPRPRRY